MQHFGITAWRGTDGTPHAYAFGYLTGEDEDLICVFPDIENKILAEKALSPTNKSKLIAIFLYFVKRFLLKRDRNFSSYFRKPKNLYVFGHPDSDEIGK